MLTKPHQMLKKLNYNFQVLERKKTRMPNENQA